MIGFSGKCKIVNIDFIGENIVLFDKQTTNKIAIGKLSLI